MNYKSTCYLSLIACSLTLLYARNKEHPEAPQACVTDASAGSSACVSNLRWIMYGDAYELQRISGVFENNTSHPIEYVELTFSLFDANDVVVSSASATMDATVPIGGKLIFNAPIEEPLGTGLRRVTMYTNQVRIVVVSERARLSFDVKLPMLFTTGNVLGVRRYKKLHAMN